MAGMNAPRGQAEPVDGGYRVNGQWAFGSGIHYAEWVIAAPFVSGQPGIEGVRVIVLPREQVLIHDNWQAAGLKPSSSCDYSIENVFVPDATTFSLMEAVLGNLSLRRCGASARLSCGRDTFSAVDTSTISICTEKAELELGAARALALQILSGIWDQARAGEMPPPEQQAQARAAAAYITEIAQGVTTLHSRRRWRWPLRYQPSAALFPRRVRCRPAFSGHPVFVTRAWPVQAPPA
jgi:indole-3-acetate monooxygenase